MPKSHETASIGSLIPEIGMQIFARDGHEMKRGDTVDASQRSLASCDVRGAPGPVINHGVWEFVRAENWCALYEVPIIALKRIG